jgi:hypothetical protein
MRLREPSKNRRRHQESNCEDLIAQGRGESPELTAKLPPVDVDVDVDVDKEASVNVFVPFTP